MPCAALRLAGLAAIWLGACTALIARDPKDHITASPAAAPTHLRVGASGRYFVVDSGDPFFYLADTTWLLFQRLNRSECDEYLKDRAAKGFTVIQSYVVRGLGKQHPDGNISLSSATPFVDNTPAAPNEEFFENVDYVVHRANELGLVMALVVAKSWHVNKHPERIFDAKSAYNFGEFLGKRFRYESVIWYVGGDSMPGEDQSVWVEMARGLRAGADGRHLISYHGSGHTSSSQWVHSEDWLDFNSIQSGHGWTAKTYEFIERDRELMPIKPTLDMEPPYENHPTGSGRRIDSHQVRQGAYWAMLAGAAGHGYGALDLFYLYQAADGPFPRDGFQDWRTALNYEGSRQMGFMRRLFELRPWWKLTPDQSLIADGQSADENHLQAAKANDGSFVVVYAPTGRTFSVNLDDLTGERIIAHWYDPRLGKWRAIGPIASRGVHEFVPPSHGANNDWVLVLDVAEMNYPTEFSDRDLREVP